MIRRVLLWFDDRLALAHGVRSGLRKPFPEHWSFLLGEVALYSFVVLVLTGIFLTFFFEASSRTVIYEGPYEALGGREMSAAFASVMRLSFEVRAGLLMRQIHHWAALLFLASMTAHLLRVFFTGAFRKPRELTWVLGLLLLLLGMGAGFTGYSLPDDLLSGTGIRIAYSVVLSIPFVGTWIAFLFFGGEFPSPDIIGRLFSLHIMVIPGLIIGALSAHLFLVWRQKHTDFRGARRTEDSVSGTPLWPTYAMKSVGLFFGVAAILTLLGGLVQINPVWLWGPFEPSTVTAPAQPDWYLGWLEGALRLSPSWSWEIFGVLIPEPFLPAVVLPGAFFTVAILWPWIERRTTGDREVHNLLDRPRDAPLRSAVGAAALTLMIVLTLAGSNDVLARYLNIQVESITMAFRALVLVGPPIVALAVYRICHGLGSGRLHPIRERREVRIRRTAAGGFEEEEEEETAAAKAAATGGDPPAPDA